MEQQDTATEISTGAAETTTAEPLPIVDNGENVNDESTPEDDSEGDDADYINEAEEDTDLDQTMSGETEQSDLEEPRRELMRDEEGNPTSRPNGQELSAFDKELKNFYAGNTPLDYKNELNGLEARVVDNEDSMKRLEDKMSISMAEVENRLSADMQSLKQDMQELSINTEKVTNGLEAKMLKLLEAMTQLRTGSMRGTTSVHSSRTSLIDNDKPTPARSSGLSIPEKSTSQLNREEERMKLLSEIRYNVNQKIERPGSWAEFAFELCRDGVKSTKAKNTDIDEFKRSLDQVFKCHPYATQQAKYKLPTGTYSWFCS